MKQVKRTRIEKKHLISLILLAAFAVALTLSLVLTSLLSDSGEQGSNVTTGITDVLEGEARQNGMPLAYPAVSNKLQIQFVAIKNSMGEFGIYHAEEDNHHTLFYVKDGETISYYPDIVAQDPKFDYTDLFAIESGDGMGKFSLVDYLCSAIQMPYFDQRVAFETDTEKLEIQLEQFGLQDGKAKTLAVTYVNDLGETVNRIIKIGDVGVTGTGYYFTVTDNGVERPYIYSSLNNYFGYAESYISRFVKPLLVSEGLVEDNGFGPYLTTGYYQWVNSFYECTCTEGCVGASCTKCSCGEYEITADSNVIVYTDTVFSITDGGEGSDGYERHGTRLTEINLGDYKKALDALLAEEGFVRGIDSRNYQRIINALVGGKIGALDKSVSIYTPEKLIDFGNGESVEYSYNITAIEALISETEEKSETGHSAGADYDAVKVTYTATVGGKAVSAHPLHAVIDFRYANIDSAAEAAIRAAKIGDAVDISFTVSYTTDNAIVKSSKYVITEIIEVYDKDGKPTDKVTADSIVGYRYSVYVDETLSGEATFYLDLKEVTEGADLEIKNKLVGKKAGKVNLSFDEHRAYYEYMLDFTTYDIDRVDSFVVSELVSAFKFQNSSERDPYYGESLYENLFDEDDNRRLYGLSSGVCETVVKILGGLSDETSTATAAGLTGDEVVAVGITPDVMKKYGLYAHKIYFELPRGITAHEPEDTSNGVSGEVLDDYSFRSTLGFNLYVSEVDPETNMRYIASDLYDIVTRVPAEDFVFLKYDFETFWARRSLMLMQITSIASLGVEFCMDDLVGNYNFELTQPTSSSKALGVHLTASGECTPSKFTEYMADSSLPTSYGGVSLKNLYLYKSNASEEEHKSASPDSLGSASFRDAMRLIYFVSYVDILGEDERKEAPEEGDLVMRMNLRLEDTKNASPYVYVYEYYRIDDRRVRVSIHQETEAGVRVTESVDDFYISTFAFKKIVNAFVGILNAEVLDITQGYKD